MPIGIDLSYRLTLIDPIWDFNKKTQIFYKEMCEIISRENNIPCDCNDGFVDIIAMNYDGEKPKDLAKNCFSGKERIPWVLPYSLVKTFQQNDVINLKLPTINWGEGDFTGNIVDVEICVMENNWRLRRYTGYDGVCFTGRPLLGLR